MTQKKKEKVPRFCVITMANRENSASSVGLNFSVGRLISYVLLQTIIIPEKYKKKMEEKGNNPIEIKSKKANVSSINLWRDMWRKH